MFDPKNFRLKSVYLPVSLVEVAERRAKGEYMNFSAYIRKLVIEDLKRENLLPSVISNNS